MLTTLAYVDWPGGQVESASAQGKYWNFQTAAHTAWPGNGSTLASVQRYLAGPCAYAGNTTCEFETRTVRRTATNNVLESITAYGRLFDSVDGAPVAGTGALLSDVPLYADICAHAAANQACRMDARSVVDATVGQAEVVFAYGRVFFFVKGILTNAGGTLLNLVYPYSDACVGIPSGSCTIDSYEAATLEGHTGTQEVFTAYGKLFIYDRDASQVATPWAGYPIDLRSVPRFRDGPCAGQ